MQTQSNKLDFRNQNLYIGLDVHLKSWTVTIMSDSLNFKTFSQPAKPEVLSDYLKKNFPGGAYYSAYEAGFCGYWIHNKLVSLGINSIVVNPADIPTTDKEKVQKEDKRDSRKIARSLRNGDLTPIYVPSLKILEDRALLRTRAQIVKDLTRYKNRIKSFLYFHGIEFPESFAKQESHWSNRFITWLESIKMEEESGNNALDILIMECKHFRSTILMLNKQIINLSRTPAYSKYEKLLRSVPGIGLLTAMTILTELETINRFSNIDNLCGFIGLVPSTHSSGDNEKTGEITHRGHIVLRSALIESSWIAIRNDPALFQCYNEYCKRMQPNKAIVRIAKKLLSRIKFVLKNEQPYVCSVIK
jgi:transposase